MEHRLRLRRLRVAALAIAALFAGCGDDDNSAAPRDGGTVDAGTDAQPLEDATSIVREFEIVDDPDGPCTPPTASATTVYPASATSPVVKDMSRVGARRVATTTVEDGFVLFDENGANASASRLSPAPIARAIGVGNEVAAFGLADSVTYHRYGADGAPIGSAVVVEGFVASTGAIGRLGDGALVVYSSIEQLRGRAMNADGTPKGEPFDLEPAAPKTLFRAAIAPVDGDAVLAWSVRRDADFQFRTFTARVTPAGISGLARRIFRSTARHEVVGLARTLGGFLLLLDVDGTTVVAPLDGRGAIVGKAHRLGETTQPFGITAKDDRAAVVTLRKDGFIALRAVAADGTGSPSSTCFEPTTNAIERTAAIDADVDGYAVLFAATDGSQKLIKIAY